MRLGRAADEMRPVTITPGWLSHAEGSALVAFGATRVLCACSVEERVPPFRRGSGGGWVTAEYALLPRSTLTRTPREVGRGAPGGRTHEIQRLIGRSLRAVVTMAALGERTVWLDCDVLQADGGTRTAAVTGAFVALVDALAGLRRRRELAYLPVADCLAAVSVGIVGGLPVLDLAYSEDARAEVDMNLVATGAGRFVEIQGTAERRPFDGDQLAQLLTLGRAGLDRLVALQRESLGEVAAWIGEPAPPPPAPHGGRSPSGR